jgi:hypothetical protein
MSWGIKVVLFYSSFVIFMIVLVSMSMRQDFDLVTDDYYRQEIAYQKRINQISNSKQLSVPLRIMVLNDSLILRVLFPENLSDIKGTIHLYCPHNAKNDQIIPIQPNDEYIQDVDIALLPKGLWRVKIEWSASGNEFYNEEVVVLQ